MFAGILCCCWPDQAAAHVKWFADYDLLCPPRSPSEILLGEYFLFFCLFVGPVMFAVACIDRHLVRRRGWALRGAIALTQRAQPHFSRALRLGVSAFLVTAASYGIAAGEAFILTPELTTQSRYVPAVQLTTAVLALLPRTALLAGLGIAALYIYAARSFGLYHLLDYPIFLGVAAYLVVESLYGRRHSGVALNAMRLGTGITLLWAAIEKFAYPEWSFPLLAERPDLRFGFDAEFYMVAAGFVEFCAAYLLITGMLSARAAALVLLFFFVSAIYYFGTIDAIGHSVIILVLVILTLSSNPLAARLDARGLARTAAIHVGIFFAAVLFFIGIYCGGHYLGFGPYPECVS